jgi:hypothetical protein
VIFSDEIKINQFQFDGRAWCWARDGESQLQSYHVTQTVEHGDVAIFLWGCMTSCGMDCMYKIKGNMIQALFLSIEWYCFSPSHVIFQYDNDPKHIAKLITQWLSLQNYDVLTWPSQSPNLSPIEHVWALV